MLGVCCLSSLSTIQLCNTSVSCDHSIKNKNKNKNINIKRKDAGCVVPARLCSPAVVHHQLLGASGLPISLTQPQLRPDPNQEWEGKHEVARWSICAITPSAVNPPHSSSWISQIFSHSFSSTFKLSFRLLQMHWRIYFLALIVLAPALPYPVWVSRY